MSPQIHRHPHVLAVQQIHAGLLGKRRSCLAKKDFLETYAAELWKAYRKWELGAGREISNHHPQHLGQSDEAIFRAGLNMDDMRMVSKREHGEMDGENVSGEIDHAFEDALDLLLEGKAKELEDMLRQQPRLVHARSSFGYRATLLHHLAANGVPIYRQQMPMNSPDLLKILLRQGADPTAGFEVYGGSFTTAQLIPSSTHPQDAGLAASLLQILNSAS